MISLGCWTRYSATGPSSRMRFTQFFDIWRAAGFDPVLHPLFIDAYTRRVLAGRGRNLSAVAISYARRFCQRQWFSRHDLHFIEKELFPGLGPRFYAPLWQSGKPYVLDYDDAVYINARPCSGAERKFQELIRRAAAVCVGNQVIGDYCRQFNPQVHFIPTALCREDYLQKTSWEIEGRPALIGWIGSATTAGMLPMIAPILDDLAKDWPLELETIGCPDNLVLPLERVVHRRLPWAGESSNQRLVNWDIGISPLEDTPFTRGKSGLRLIKFMLSGMPFVCSPVGINADLAATGAGLAATTPEQWRQALAELLTNESLRQKCGQIGMDIAAREYTVKQVGKKLVSLFMDFL